MGSEMCIRDSPDTARAVRQASEFADQLIEISQSISEQNTNAHACNEELDVALDVICAALELLAVYQRAHQKHQA